MIYNHPIRQYNIPLIYLPLIVLANWVIICYRFHLLREPGNSIDDGVTLGVKVTEVVFLFLFLILKVVVDGCGF